LTHSTLLTLTLLWDALAKVEAHFHRTLFITQVELRLFHKDQKATWYHRHNTKAAATATRATQFFLLASFGTQSRRLNTPRNAMGMGLESVTGMHSAAFFTKENAGSCTLLHKERRPSKQEKMGSLLALNNSNAPFTAEEFASTGAGLTGMPTQFESRGRTTTRVLAAITMVVQIITLQKK
jgi:hypothetical protein